MKLTINRVALLAIVMLAVIGLVSAVLFAQEQKVHAQKNPESPPLSNIPDDNLLLMTNAKIIADLRAAAATAMAQHYQFRDQAARAQGEMAKIVDALNKKYAPSGYVVDSTQYVLVKKAATVQ